MSKFEDNLQEQVRSINHSGALKIIHSHDQGKLVVPQEVELEESEGETWIKYRFPVSGETRNPQGALASFIKLADHPSMEHFKKFAQQWGVLCFCEHQLVASHNPECFPLCEEPTYSNFQKALQEKEGMKRIGRKLMLAYQDVWFKEPLSLWIKYASSMRAMIRIFLNLRGDARYDTVADWNVLRQVASPFQNGESVFPAMELEQVAGVPIHQAHFVAQASALGHILNGWIIESNLVPRVGWYYKGVSVPLAAQCSLNASYLATELFDAPYLTLFGVLVEQCIRTLGSQPYIRQCACTGCSNHNGPCDELVEIPENPGRPNPYCPKCYKDIRRQQKRDSKKKARRKGSNLHE